MMKMKIPFNKPYLTGKENSYISQAVESCKLSGNGKYTQLCQQFFEEKYAIRKALLTTSCTDALEMAAILLNIKEGDEVIVPSFTFVSTANAFVLRGANVIFCDSYPDNPNIDPDEIEKLITPRTKAIVPVHYAGVACDMDRIMEIAKKHNIYVIEDAAQGIDSYYKSKPLGSIGHMAAFSFHETKNIISGEGGLLAINDEQFVNRAEIIWEKGTNRSAFWRGEVDKYGWVDIGSSFLPSEIIAAFLYAQLENLESIQKKRKEIWSTYHSDLQVLEKSGKAVLPSLPDYATNNAHMFYLVCRNLDERTKLLEHLKEKGINAVFHYISLHSSPFYTSKHDGRALKVTDHYSDCLVRLPFFYELEQEQIRYVTGAIIDFFNQLN